MIGFRAWLRLREDAIAVNAVGPGCIAGVGIGPQGEPGGRKSLLRRKPWKRLRDSRTSVRKPVGS